MLFNIRSLLLYSTSLIGALSVASCGNIVIVSNLGFPESATVLNPDITASDKRAIKGIELRGLRVGPEMDEIQTVPSVAQVIRIKLSSELGSLKTGDKVEASVISASCQIVNRYATGSASIELHIEAQFNVSGKWHSKVLVAGDSDRDFKIGMLGVPAKEWCSEHFLSVSSGLAKDASVFYGQLVSE